MRTYEVVRDGVRLPVRDHTGRYGPPILALHGWPQDGTCWDGVAAALTATGRRVVVPDLRGSRPAAAPAGRWAYRTAALVADVRAIIDAVGEPVHLVGHDWGSALAWYVAASQPDLVRTLTAVSVPHPGAFARSLLTSRQVVASWYLAAFQLPWLPELYLGTPHRASALLQRTGLPRRYADAYAARLADRRVARGGLNWYRAALLTGPRLLRARLRAPVLQVWSDRDVALTDAAMRRGRFHTEAAFAYEVLHDVPHWIPETAPDRLAELILRHVTPPS